MSDSVSSIILEQEGSNLVYTTNFNALADDLGFVFTCYYSLDPFTNDDMMQMPNFLTKSIDPNSMLDPQIGVVNTNIDLTGYYVGLVASDISGTPIMSNIVQFLAQYTTTPPTTLPPTTDVPTTQPVTPTTDVPTTQLVTPTTAPPTLPATTDVPTTDVPTTDVPTTAQPTLPPTTDVPTTAQPTLPPTLPPTTDIPTTAPTTDVPTTDVPTTAPTTDVPTTQTTLRKKPIKKPKKTTKPTTKRPTTKKPRPTTKKPKRPRNRSKIVVNPETPTYNLSQRLHKRLIYFNS